MSKVYMNIDFTKASRSTEPDDIILWPDGDCCFADELHEYSYKSDDYKVIKPGTQWYDDLIAEMGF